MIARWITACLALIFSTASLLAATSPQLSARFDSATSYGVPGVVLPAGSFTIDVSDHLSDRYIVEIKDQANDVLATFLGLPSTKVGTPANDKSSGKIIWPNSSKGVTYLKGWYFPKASVSLEFVYPKADAVAIAQANHTRVAAIDPASDGLLISPSKELTAKDLQIVTLWLLKPTQVGATGAAGIEAKRYDQVATLTHAPVARTLPHTASNLAWFYLLGSASIAGALTMRMRRVRCAV